MPSVNAVPVSFGSLGAYAVPPPFPPDPTSRGSLRLMAAFLELNIKECLDFALLKDRRARRMHRDAYDWLFSNEDQGYVFSVWQVCEALGVDVGALRKRIRARLDNQEKWGTHRSNYTRDNGRALYDAWEYCDEA